MKCENCGYTHGYGWDEKGNYVDTIGSFGEFYTLPLGIVKREGSEKVHEAAVKGCPSCKIVFLGYD